MKLIKNSFVLVSFCLFYSCDKEQCSEFIIENTTTTDLIMLEYFDGQISNNLSLERNSEITVSNYMCDTNSPPIFSFFPADSIELRDNEQAVKRTYYPFDEGRNIFLTFDSESWERRKDTNNFTIFAFIIREEDIAQ